jgi:hypothetical protein
MFLGIRPGKKSVSGPHLTKLWGQSAAGEVYPPRLQPGSSNPGKNKS